MRRPPSLTLRLTVLFGVAAAIVFSGFGWVIERSIEHHFQAEDVTELQVIARAVAVALSTATTDGAKGLQQRFSDILVGHHLAELYIAEQDGRTLFANQGGPDLSAIAREDSKNELQTVRLWHDEAEHYYRIITRRLNVDGHAGHRIYIMSIAVTIDYHLRFLGTFRRTLWIMISSGIALMGFMGWIAVRQGHAPLHSIIARIRNISAKELNTRLSPETVPKELTDLADSFNEMLERMEEAFQRLSNYSADIAHELRTPVTNLLTQTQVALSQSRTLDEYREILYSNMEEYERMARMISDMLFLAKADIGLYKPDTAAVDLNEEIRALFEFYEAWAEENGVTLTVEGDAAVTGDRLMLRRALSNLLSNAIRHTPAGETVRVCIKQAQTVSVCVENPGHPIAAEHLPRLFDRFYRVESVRPHGGECAGLGLAIVKSIVELHTGKIEVNSNEQSTRFQITLPITA